MDNYSALLIEDDFNWVYYFQETIAKNPKNCFNFTYAETLKDGLSLLNQNTYSLILLDLMLPDSQGQDTILSVVEKVKHTPIVILTTLADAKMQEFAYSQGIEDYLVKDEYDDKLFFHVVNASVKRCISRIQQELNVILDKLKLVSDNLDKIAE